VGVGGEEGVYCNFRPLSHLLIPAVFPQDYCFCQEQDDGTNAYGTGFCTTNDLQCTRHKVISADDTGAYDVTIPAVEDLMLRSACCCYYCGCACAPKHKPLGMSAEFTTLCYQAQGGCNLLTTAVRKRACCSLQGMFQQCSCESEGSSEFILVESSSSGLCLCISEFGNACKISCCPTPLTCIGSQGQTCCYFSRMNFPCNDLTPCEVGCCGIFCIKKEEQIMEAEQRIRDRMSGGAVEAVIVEKGGAPVEVMER